VAAPGAVVSIFGANLGSPVKATKFDQFGMYPTTAGNVGVTFNGVAAALTYVSANQINAVVPNEVAGQGTARVVVAHHDERSAEFSVAVQETAPGIYMVGDGTSQGAITQTPPLSGNPVTVNSAANPVEKRGAIVFYATGAGLWNQDVRAGQVVFAPIGALEVKPRAPLSVKIGGREARLFWFGAAAGTAGVIQVNAFVPEDIGSGPQPIELTIGANSNLPQVVTVHVR